MSGREGGDLDGVGILGVGVALPCATTRSGRA
jgi:hypothetical protein